ncbi:MAG: ATP-binding cassette domain-containing protein [Algisphaera sp.]
MTSAQHNPFRVDRLEALDFRPHDPARSLGDVVSLFRDAGWHGAIVGPHGSGKSTLLRHLAQVAHAEGHEVQGVFTNRSMSFRDRAGVVNQTLTQLAVVSESKGPRAVVCFDGWCHLTPGQRWRIKRAAVRAGAGVLGLAHLCGWGLPVIYRTRTTPELLYQLACELHPMTAKQLDVTRHLGQSRGNLRTALLRLYDDHKETHQKSPGA